MTLLLGANILLSPLFVMVVNAEGVREFEPRATPWEGTLQAERRTLKELANSTMFAQTVGNPFRVVMFLL